MLVGAGRVKIKGLPNDQRILCITQNMIMLGKYLSSFKLPSRGVCQTPGGKRNWEERSTLANKGSFATWAETLTRTGFQEN